MTAAAVAVGHIMHTIADCAIGSLRGRSTKYAAMLATIWNSISHKCHLPTFRSFGETLQKVSSSITNINVGVRISIIPYMAGFTGSKKGTAANRKYTQAPHIIAIGKVQFLNISSTFMTVSLKFRQMY